MTLTQIPTIPCNATMTSAIESAMRMEPGYEQDALAWLLDEDTCDAFVATHLGKSHFLRKSDRRDRFQTLLTFEQLDEMFGTFGLRFADLRLARSESSVHPAEYCWKEDLVDPMRAARLFAEGYTLIFNALQDRHGRVQHLCACLSRQGKSRTQANVYLTPPNSQGFDVHWDSHDVFILQVEGDKQWRIYDGGVANPLSKQRFDPASFEAGEVVDDFILEPGDVLYIPRGVAHACQALDRVSLHITLGVIPYTWSDLLTDCVADLGERAPAWRESLPFGFRRNDHEGNRLLRQQFLARLAELPEVIDLDGVVEARLDQMGASQRPRATDHLRQAIDASEVLSTHALRKRTGLQVRLNTRGDRVSLVCGERELDFPVAAQRTLEAVLQEAAVPFGHIDDELDESGRKLVISTLIREGIVQKIHLTR